MNSRLRNIGLLILTIIIAVSVIQCGGNGDSAPPTGPTAVSPTLTFTAVKIFHFSWTDDSNATHYKLLENPDGISGFIQVGSDIPQGTQAIDHVVPLYARINAQYILQSCNAVGCTDSTSVSVSGSLVASIGYIKASNTDTSDIFGRAVSLSADGNTLVVGAWHEASNDIGINGDQTDNSAPQSGAAYVFSRNGTIWSQQAYVKASNTDAIETFGHTVSLSADGNTMVVAAPSEASSDTGINGDQNDNLAGGSGAVYVFSRSGTIWAQQTYIKASNTGINDVFGHAVHLSADGNTLAVGAIGEASNATGINGNQTDNSASSSGAVYIFSHSGTTWAQQAYIKASNTETGDAFGKDVSLSRDGNILAVGAFYEYSNATGIDGDQSNNLAPHSGAVYVFSRNGTIWSQQAYVKASNTESGANFGINVSLSVDGNTLAIGAVGEASNTTGINGDQSNNTATASGAAYIFSRNGTIWSQQAYIKASNTDAFDIFGQAVSLSADGNTLAVGAYGEASKATGIGGDQADNLAPWSGAVYVFNRKGTTWSQQAYIKASNTDMEDFLGEAVSLSADGNTLAVGAYGEDSKATGIGGDQADNLAPLSGAVFLY